MSSQPSRLLRQFEARTLDPTSFGHIQHVAVAYEMIVRYGFAETMVHYAAGIRAMAEAASAPDKYNETVTVAFLSLIAERIAADGDMAFETFINRNSDLLDKDVLARWYSSERLQSDLARRMFVLPDKVAAA